METRDAVNIYRAQDSPHDKKLSSPNIASAEAENPGGACPDPIFPISLQLSGCLVTKKMANEAWEKDGGASGKACASTVAGTESLGHALVVAGAALRIRSRSERMVLVIQTLNQCPRLPPFDILLLRKINSYLFQSLKYITPLVVAKDTQQIQKLLAKKDRIRTICEL